LAGYYPLKATAIALTLCLLGTAGEEGRKRSTSGMSVNLVGRASREPPAPQGGRNPIASHSIKGLRWINSVLTG
jgi:hypothetical protein